MKMIGVARLRARERTRRAVSKPSMPGIATSRMISAKSCSSRRASASTPDRASTSLRPSGSERGFDRDQVGVVVIDDEDVAAVREQRRRAPVAILELAIERLRGAGHEALVLEFLALAISVIGRGRQWQRGSIAPDAEGQHRHSSPTAVRASRA